MISISPRPTRRSVLAASAAAGAVAMLPRPSLAAAVGVSVAGSADDKHVVHPMAAAEARLALEGELPSFGGATEWLNSPPHTPAELRGRVVLVGFWTLTCINWLRSSPYVRAWADKYKDRGLAVIGVHAPEFKFEKNLDDVRRSARDMGSITRSLSTTIMRSGARSGTSIGRRSISSMRRAISATIDSAKARGVRCCNTWTRSRCVGGGGAAWPRDRPRADDRRAGRTVGIASARQESSTVRV